MGIMKKGDYKTKLMCGDAKVKRAYAGDVRVYSSGNICSYYVDAGVMYQEEVEEGASCLAPRTFSPAKAGWVFAGWREDAMAVGSALTSKVMGDVPVALYAVFAQTITVSYAGNGATGGGTAAQSGWRYYNNGNVLNPTFVLQANGFSLPGYRWTCWAGGSPGGAQYASGAAVTLAASIVFYAVWAYIPVAHTVAPDSVTWTKSSSAGVNTNLTVSGSKVTIAVTQGGGTTAYGHVAATAYIPTGACTRLQLTVSFAIYSIPYVVVDGERKDLSNTYGSGVVEFNVSGKSGVTVSFGIYVPAGSKDGTLSKIQFLP